jgi:putative addiction module CopG family antidote
MSTIPLELPAELQTFVDARAQAGHYGSASEYIVALVDAARRSQSSLEAALLDGLSSGPAEEWTSDEWAEIRNRVMARRQKG